MQPCNFCTTAEGRIASLFTCVNIYIYLQKNFGLNILIHCEDENDSIILKSTLIFLKMNYSCNVTDGNNSYTTSITPPSLSRQPEIIKMTEYYMHMLVGLDGLGVRTRLEIQGSRVQIRLR